MTMDRTRRAWHQRFWQNLGLDKSARVVEEVVLKREVHDRVETIRDTLRKEEIEVDGPENARLAS